MIDKLALERRAFIRTYLGDETSSTRYLPRRVGGQSGLEELSELELTFFPISTVVAIFDEYAWRAARGATPEMALRRIELNFATGLAIEPLSVHKKLDRYIETRLVRDFSSQPLSSDEVERLMVLGEMWFAERGSSRICSKRSARHMIPLPRVENVDSGGNTIVDYASAEDLRRAALSVQELLFAARQRNERVMSRRELLKLEIVPRIGVISAGLLSGLSYVAT